MNEDFVTYKTAKLANEKGIKIDINSFYAIDDSLYEEGTRFEVSECTCHTEDDYCTCQSGEEYSYSKKCIYAPTQSLLQKYLRNKYRIHIEIPHYSDCPTKYFDDDNYNDELGSYGVRIHEPNTQAKMDIFVSNINYEKYEEALEVALIEGLKLI